MFLAVVILVSLALACFFMYRMLDLAVAAAHEAKFGGFVASVPFANKFVSSIHAFCTTFFAVVILVTGDWSKRGRIELVDSRHRGSPSAVMCALKPYIDIRVTCKCKPFSCRYCGSHFLGDGVLDT